MTLLLKQIYSFIQLLNSDTGTNQLSAGLAIGLVLGFSPFLSLQTFLVIFLCFFFRIQLGAAFLSAFFFKFIAFILDPIADSLGQALLENETLRPAFISLYNMPIIPMTRFNNSIIMGSGLIGFILAIPMFFVFKKLIIKYRFALETYVRDTKWWKAMKATAFFKWYDTYSKLYN